MAFTIKEADIEQHIMAKLPAVAQNIVKRVYLAGMKFLFSPATHDKIMKELDHDLATLPSSIGTQLGANAAHMMIFLFNQSKGTMPKGAMIPAGVMLLAKFCEFLNESGTPPLTDKVFTEAVHVMTVALMSHFDKNFNQKIGAQQIADQVRQAHGMPTAQQQPQAPQQTAQTPSAGGLLGSPQ